jgi:hypothetical protein
MKRKTRKSIPKRNRRGRKHPKFHKSRKRLSKRRRRFTRRRLSIAKTQAHSKLHLKALAVLSVMRRRGWSLNKASKLEHIKAQTVLRHVGKALYRRGPGKPWKATKSDRLAEKMAVLTAKGLIYEPVRSSIERTRLSRYNTALRMWRDDEDGADQELLAFKGQTVAGHVLITNPDTLVELEEADKLDFDAFYYSIGGDQ